MSKLRTHGAGLVELVVAMVLAGVVLGGALAAARHAHDRRAVEGARSTAAGLIERGRTLAVAAGGAVVRLDTASATVVVRDAHGIEVRRMLGDEFGVWLDLAGRASHEVRFDAAGIGRVANATVGFARGAARTELVISLFGRVRE